MAVIYLLDNGFLRHLAGVFLVRLCCGIISQGAAVQDSLTELMNTLRLNVYMLIFYIYIVCYFILKKKLFKPTQPCRIARSQTCIKQLYTEEPCFAGLNLGETYGKIETLGTPRT